MIALNELVSDSINLVPEFKIYRQFELDKCKVWYVIGNTTEPRKDYIDTLICKELSSKQEGFHNYFKRTKDSNKLVKIAGNIFLELGWGKLDDNDTITINAPFNHLFKLSFGDIYGFIDNEGRSFGSEESQNFRIYMAPNEKYFKDMDRNLKNPIVNSYHFFLEDLFRYGIEKKQIPNIIQAQNIEFMYRRTWFSKLFVKNEMKKQYQEIVSLLKQKQYM